MNPYDSDFRYQTAPELPAEPQQPVQRRPDQLFCRDCGRLVDSSASVCIHCGYVLNRAALQQAEMLIQERAAQQRTRQRIRNIFRIISGEPLEESPQLVPSRRQYRFQTSGSVYCPNCGTEVADGASICIYCKYVLDPQAIRRAQMLVRDRTAKLTAKDFLKSLLIPGYGKQMYRKYRNNRPQIANPCRVAAGMNAVLIAAAIIVLVWLL